MLYDASVPDNNRALVTVFKSGRVTFASVSYMPEANDKDIFITTGEAIRQPEDKEDDYIAERLAVGRAFKKLGRELEKSARTEVYEIDVQRQRQREIAEKKRKEAQRRRKKTAKR